MRTPAISVVIPTHNRPEALRRLLKSMERQTLPASEVIVVDDASRDPGKIISLIKEYQGRLRRLTYLRNPTNRGGSYSRNRGIRLAKSPLIALSDDDDEWMPQKLGKLAQCLTLHWHDTDLAFTWLLVKNEGGLVARRFKPWMRGGNLQKFLGDISGALPNPSATLIKREWLLRAGLFDENLPGCQDWDMWLRILKAGGRCRPVEGFWTIKHLQAARISNSIQAKKGFFLLALKHFRLFSRVNPVVFLHLAWFTTGIKLGLREKLMNPKEARK